MKVSFFQNKQRKCDTLQQGLQFKQVKKRGFKRPIRSKSSFTVKSVDHPFLKDTDYNQISNRQNQISYSDDNYNQKQAHKKQNIYFEPKKHFQKSNIETNGRGVRRISQINQPIVQGQPGQPNTFRQTYPLYPLISKNSFHPSLQVEQTKQRQSNQLYTPFNCSWNIQQLSSHTRNRSESINIESKLWELDQENQQQHDFTKKTIMGHITSLKSSFGEKKSKRKQFTIKQFNLGLCFKEDIFGKTYEARHKESGFVVSIKIVSKKEVKGQLQRFIESIKIQSICNFSYVVDIYGIFQDKACIYVVMQYHKEGDLFVKLKSERGLEENDYISYFFNFSQALRDLHGLNIVYRNFYPQKVSLLYDSCKLSNFVWSVRLDHIQNANIGAIQYSAPETFSESRYCKQSDIWGLGIFLYELIYGVTPCYKLSFQKSKKKLTEGQFDYPETGRAGLKLLKKMLVKQASERMSLNQIIKQKEDFFRA